MCHHFIGFQMHDRLPKSRAMWRCSMCGRESQAPIDCCMRPTFAVIPQPGIGHAVRQWLRAVATQAVTGLAAIRQRRQSAEPDICTPEVAAGYMDIEAGDPLLPEMDTETAELQETTHAAL